MRSKTIEQLENDYWNQEIEFPSNLVINCHKYRKVPINELTIEQLRLLISQKIGLKYIIGIALEQLEKNALSEGDLYEGDLLTATSSISSDFWTDHKSELLRLINLVSANSKLLANVLGEKELNRIQERLEIASA